MTESQGTKHYDAEHLLAYLHERLDEDEMLNVEEHLEKCDECAERSCAVFRASDAWDNWADTLTQQPETASEMSLAAALRQDPVKVQPAVAAGLRARLLGLLGVSFRADGAAEIDTERRRDLLDSSAAFAFFQLPQWGAVRVSGGPAPVRGSFAEAGSGPGKLTVEASGAGGLVRVRLEDPGGASPLPELEMVPASEDQKSVTLEWRRDGRSSGVLSIAWGAGGLLAVGCEDGATRIWSPGADEPRNFLEGHSEAVAAVAFSSNGETLASGSADGTVMLWDAATGQPLRTLKGHSEFVTSVAFHRGVLASASGDSTIRLWDVPAGNLLLTLSGHTGPVMYVAFGREGELLASGSADGTVKLWDSQSGRLLRSLTGHAGVVSSVAFRSGVLASGSEDETVRLWDPVTGRLLHSLEGHSAAITAVAFAPDAEVLASASYDKTIRIWDARGGRLLRTIECFAEVTSVAFDPTGTTVAGGCLDGTVHRLDPRTGHRLGEVGTRASWIAEARVEPGDYSLAILKPPSRAE